MGGEILPIEVTLMPGKGSLTLTGKLGDVMQESARAALSWVRSKAEDYGIARDFNRRLDVHIHVPEGAIPKDGPSAGITIATALMSALTKVAVRRDVAMTGEITLRGKVLPIGGVKEKLLAAHRIGVTTIILPRENEKDLADVPKVVLDAMTVDLVEHVEEVLKIALVPPSTPQQPEAEPPAAAPGGRRHRRPDALRPPVVFAGSAASPDQFPRDRLPEVAFLGRSNVGKSSLLNALAGTRNLARVSSRPGHTRLVNFYRVGHELYLADLPGYGYARVPEAMRRGWEELVTSYLVGREPLALGVFLVDLRHEPMEGDVDAADVPRPPGAALRDRGGEGGHAGPGRGQRSAWSALRRGLGRQAVDVLPVSAKTGDGVRGACGRRSARRPRARREN